MIPFTAAIHSKQCNQQGDGSVTVTILNPAGITTVDGNASRPAIVGDVYSIQPAGTTGEPVVQGRPAGANGAYEKAMLNGTFLTWAPQGASGYCVIAPLAQSIPNV